jgi:tetratricopeptide (TPR) repeat protein
MSRSRSLSLLGVLGTVGLCLALAKASGQRPDDHSQRAADIPWFLDRARQATGNIADLQQKVDAYRSIAKAHAKVGDAAAFKEAIDLAKQAMAGVKDPVYKGRAYVRIADTQARAGDIAGAMETATGIQDHWWKGGADAAIAGAQARAGEFENALKMAAGIEKRPSVKDRAYADIAEAQARAGDFAAAMETTSGIAEAQHRIRAYCLVAQIGAAAGKSEALKDALEAAKKLAASIDLAQQSEAYETIAEAQARAGEIAAAVETAAHIQDVVPKAQTYAAIATAQARAGHFTEALRTAGAILEPSNNQLWKARAYCSIAEVEAQVGDIQASKKAFDALKKVAAALGEPYSRVEVYCMTAEAQAGVGDRAASKKTAELAKQAGARIPAWDYPEGPYARAKISRAQARAGDVAGARQTAAAIRDKYDRAQAYGEIAEAEARAGQVEGVKAWVETLKEPEEVVAVCLGAVEGLLGEEGITAGLDRSR